MRAIITGGAGYIGAHMSQRLIDEGCDVLVLDNLSTGHADALCKGAQLRIADLREQGDWCAWIKGWRPDVVFHFAAQSIVGESCAKPWDYLHHNTSMTLNLLDTLKDIDTAFVFSSSCAVYGASQENSLDEQHALMPESPYAESKRIGEQLTRSCSHQYGLTSVVLRYFNVAGCADAYRLRERHEPETHLIPNLLRAAQGHECFKLYGDNHPTPDGTAIRDYVHVQDLVEAHLMTAKKLKQQVEGFHDVFNLGTSCGHSVLQVLKRVEAITGRSIDHCIEPARLGDAPCLLANSQKWQQWIRKDLAWHQLDDMIQSAWKQMQYEQT